MKKVLFILPLLLIGCSSTNELSTSIITCNPPISTSSKSEATSSTVTSSGIIPEGGIFTLNYDNVPSSKGSGYPSEGEYLAGEHTFYFSDVMGNNGKYDIDTIQMKKESSYFYNVNEIHGRLTITIMKNSYHDYTNNVDVNTEVVPIVYVSKDKTFTNQKIEGIKTNEDNNKITYVFEDSVLYSYFKIVNESSYAQYLESVTWVW